MGHDKNTEGSSDRWPVPSCCACMQGGGNHKAGDTAGKGGGKKKLRTKPRSDTGGREVQSERAAGGTGWSKRADERPRVAREKKRQKQQRRVTRWGKGTANGGRGGHEEGTTTDPEESTPPKRKGAGRERTVLVTRTGLRQDADPVAPRQMVAGGPVG